MVSIKKPIQMMIGPTAIPDRVLRAMNHISISHRSKEYSAVHERVTTNLKRVLNTENEVLILTSSGTGAMEAVILNCFSPGDEIVVPVIGKFSEQYAQMAEIYGLKVKRVMFEYGRTADVEIVMKEVTSSTKGVFVVHNESSTGIYNDIEAFGKALKDTNALLVADSVSGLGGLEIRMDEWNIDVVLTSSQKALMSPAGLAFVALSEKAWSKVECSSFPKYYFDFKIARKFNEIHQTLTTPGVYTLFAVDEALKMIFEEGLENIYIRNKNNTELLLEGIKETGLNLLAKDEKFASPTLTAVHVPGKSKYFISELAKRDVIVGGGMPPLTEDVFRVGTMGYVSKNDVTVFLHELKDVVKSLNL